MSYYPTNYFLRKLVLNSIRLTRKSTELVKGTANCVIYLFNCVYFVKKVGRVARTYYFSAGGSSDCEWNGQIRRAKEERKEAIAN